MKRFLSWVVMILSIPAAAILYCAVNTGLFALRDQIVDTNSPEFLANILEEDLSTVIGITQIVALILMLLVYAVFALMSDKICKSKNGGRFLAAAICCIPAAVLFVFWRVRGLPFELPFPMDKGILTGAALALFLLAFCMYFSPMRKRRKDRKTNDTKKWS